VVAALYGRSIERPYPTQDSRLRTCCVLRHQPAGGRTPRMHTDEHRSQRLPAGEGGEPDLSRGRMHSHRLDLVNAQDLSTAGNCGCVTEGELPGGEGGDGVPSCIYALVRLPVSTPDSALQRQDSRLTTFFLRHQPAGGGLFPLDRGAIAGAWRLRYHQGHFCSDACDMQQGEAISAARKEEP
jgi:hypothetical protein